MSPISTTPMKFRCFYFFVMTILLGFMLCSWYRNDYFTWIHAVFLVSKHDFFTPTQKNHDDFFVDIRASHILHEYQTAVNSGESSEIQGPRQHD
jgi:hypothetical protein